MILKMSKARGRMFAKLSDEVRVGDYAEAAQTAAVYVDILLEENAPASDVEHWQMLQATYCKIATAMAVAS